MNRCPALLTALILSIVAAGCGSDEPPESGPSSSPSDGADPVPEVSEFEGTFTGDIAVTKGSFESFAKGQRTRDVVFVLDCADLECSTADLRLDVSPDSSYSSTMALTREGDAWVGDAVRTNPCPSGEGVGTSNLAWTLTSDAGDRLEGVFDLDFKGCGTPGKATSEVTAERTTPSVSYLDAQAGTGLADAFATYDASLAGLYTDYNGCIELRGPELSACILPLYEPWTSALDDLVEPLGQALEAADGVCRSRLEELDLAELTERQDLAITALEQLKAGESPRPNERLITLALKQHEALLRALLMCASPSDTEASVPADGFVLDANKAVLDS